MKVGVYNRWLSTMGGGERHTLAIASHLAKTHDVTVIGHTPVDAASLSARLHLDVANVAFGAVPLRPPVEMGPIAAGYDLFINASNQDFVPPRARRNAMMVYFPATPPVVPGARLRRRVGQWIVRLSRLPAPIEGVYGSQEAFGERAHGLGRAAQFALPACARPYTVRLLLAAAAPTVTGADLALDGETVASVRFAECGRYVGAAVTVTAGGRSRTLSIQACGSADGPVSLYATPPQADHLPARVYRRLFAEAWPGLGVRLQNPLPENLRAIAAGYDLIWANSRYTQRWIDIYWHLPSTVLYPPVDVAQFAPHSKRPQILSVGRFFAGQHNKKHLVMVEQFRQMADAGLGGWELHLAGGSTPGAAHEDYLRRVRAAAAGYPIRIYVDLAFERLVELVGASSIYWHAGGYGESEALHPVRFEHFGITAVEAMAAGCAPVLIGRGGLAELVRHGEDGYLWYTTDELRRHTRRLMDDASLRSRIAQAAMVRSRRFDLPAFEADLDRSLAPLLNG